MSWHFGGFHRDHHTWRPRVTVAEEMPTRCEKEDVCAVCGKTRQHGICLCDTAHADRDAILEEWLQSPHARK